MNRSAVGACAGLLTATAFLVSPLMDGEAKAGCFETFSKYSGSQCADPPPDEVMKPALTVVAGCMGGTVGWTPASIGYGCLTGFAAVVIDWGWG